MNDVTVPTPNIVLLPAADLRNMSTQRLREELAKSLTFSAKHLTYLAAVWSELEGRGEDLTELRTGLAAYLPQIAADRLDAEAVVRFAGQPTVLRSISGLPLDRQRALAQGELVPVLTIDEQGKAETVELPAYTLTAAQARVVFSGDKIRGEKEQRAVLEAQRIKKISRTRPGPQNRVRYDGKADLLRIGRSSATIGEVTAALALAESFDAGAPADVQVIVKLTESEHRMLKIRAIESGMPAYEYMRLMLKRACAL